MLNFLGPGARGAPGCLEVYQEGHGIGRPAASEDEDNEPEDEDNELL